MSVRKVYRVIVNGETVFSGSYNTAIQVYESLANTSDLFDDSVPFDVALAFKPDDLLEKRKKQKQKKLQEGGLFDVKENEKQRS
ncbi:MAG: hypothetical protein [Chaetfec virus UA24_2563]|nr:MAG: hypothetical protein [Chaetfec virus UA24_2563]